MNDIIQIKSVTKIYPGNITAVADLTLSVKAGEFVTLLGPSGCGKTTTLRMIAGFEIPTAGKIFLAGEDVTDRPPYERQVNTVFQDYALFPHMNIMGMNWMRERNSRSRRTDATEGNGLLTRS